MEEDTKPETTEAASRAAVVHANKDTFDAEVLQAPSIVVVDFWASWCGPCMMMGPIFEEAAVMLGDKAKFVKVQLDDPANLGNQELAQSYSVMSIPAIVFFKNGKEVDRALGVIQKEVLAEKINTLSGTTPA